MKWLGISIIFTLMLLPMGIFPLSTVDAQASEPVIDVQRTYTTSTIPLPDGSSEVKHTTHFPYYFDGSDYVAYELSETPQVVQVIVDGGKFVFDKENTALTIFNDKDAVISQNGTGAVINSDSYIVRNAEIGSDVWSALAVNDVSSTTTINEDGENLTVTFTKENNEGILSIEYLIRGPEIKTTASFENTIYDNHKFGFTETLNMGSNIIILNDQTINLDEYVGQSFDRDALLQYLDIMTEAKDIHYNAGIGIDNLWSVSIHDNNRVALDYANSGETQTAIGETVILDPTLTSGTSSQGAVYDGTTGGNCQSSGNHGFYGSAMFTGFNYGSGYYDCFRGYSYWDISTIPTTATITDVVYKFDMNAYTAPNQVGMVYVAMDGITTSSSAITVWNQMNTGTVYVPLDTTGIQGPQTALTLDLGTDADSDIQGYLSSGQAHFGIGYIPDPAYNSSYGGVARIMIHNSISIDITYTVPTVPDVPTSFTATDNGLTPDLAWTVPASDGGSAITNYFMERSDSNFSQLTADYETDFSSSTGWSDTGSTILVQNGVIEWDGNRQNVNKGVAYDLGTALSNSAFVTQFDLSFTAMGTSSGGGTSVMGIMLTDTDETSNSNDCRDYIGLNFAFRTSSDPDIYNSFNAMDDNAGTKSWAHNSGSGGGQCVGLYETGTDDTTDPAEATGSPLSYYHAGDDYHIKIIRGSTTAYTVEIWDQNGGTLLDTLVGAVDSNTQGLQYILVQAYYETSNLSGTWTGTIDNMEIYDGVSSTEDIDYSAMTGSTSTTHTDTSSPTVATTWNYRVSAVNSVGTGLPSNVDSAFIGSPPDPPTSLTSVINNPDPSPLVIDLAWTTPSSMGSGTLTGYEVWRDSVLITTTTGAGTTYQDTVSPPGGTFVYEVKTVTNHGTSTASNQSSITTPTVPDPPTISLAINNPDPSPLDITITFTPPGNNGGSAITGYSLEHSTDDITYSTVAGGPFTTSTTHTVSAGTQYYKATAINNVGSSALSSAQNIATPTITTPPQNLAATVLNDTSIDLTWDVPSSDGGSALVNYYVYRNSVNIQTVTSPLSFSDTGLTPNTTYTYQVYANNNVGMSASSNTILPTTYYAITGSITASQTVSGVSVLIDPTITTTGTPSPTFTEIKVYDNGVLHSTQAMGNTDCGAATDCVSYHFPINDLTAHNVTLAVTDSSHWSTPTITSAIISVSPDYKANWDSNNVAFNVTRNTTDTILIVNRDTSIGWDLSCDLQTTAQAMSGTTGTHVRQVTSAWYFDTTSNPYPIGSGEHIYGECKEGSTTVLTFTSYGPNLIAGGINLFDSHMSDFLGLENAAILFVVIVAALFTGRTANTGILVVLSVIAILASIGFMVIDQAIWGIIMLLGACGIFIGKRFL